MGELFVGFPGSKLPSLVQSSEAEKEAWLGPDYMVSMRANY